MIAGVLELLSILIFFAKVRAGEVDQVLETPQQLKIYWQANLFLEQGSHG